MTTTAVVHKTIDLRHGKTRYIDVGTGEPLLMLHISSIEGGADDCLATLDVLSAKFRVIAPDLIGWPPSDTFDGIDAFPNIIDHLRELQDALGIEKWHVVGASMGGSIAGLFAYESPDRVIKAVIGGHPFTGAANRRMINYTIDMITTDDKVREWVENVTKGQGVDTEALVQEKLAKINEPGFREAFTKVMLSMGNPTNRDRYAMMHRFPHMRVPYMVLIAEHDEAAMGLKDQVTAAVRASGEIKTIPSQHRMHLEDPELFANTVKDYLSK